MSIFTFSQIHSAFVLFIAIFFQLRVPVCAYSKMDFEVKTSWEMFSDVVQIQLDTSLYSQFTALQRAHVIIADFRPKFTGVF